MAAEYLSTKHTVFAGQDLQAMLFREGQWLVFLKNVDGPIYLSEEDGNALQRVMIMKGALFLFGSGLELLEESGEAPVSEEAKTEDEYYNEAFDEEPEELTYDDTAWV